MRRSESGSTTNWGGGRLSASSSSIRSSNYTPSRTYGSTSLSQYKPSSYGASSGGYSSYTSPYTSTADRSLTRSSTTSAASGRSLTRSDSAGTSLLSRTHVPTTTTTYRSPYTSSTRTASGGLGGSYSTYSRGSDSLYGTESSRRRDSVYGSETTTRGRDTSISRDISSSRRDNSLARDSSLSRDSGFRDSSLSRNYSRDDFSSLKDSSTRTHTPSYQSSERYEPTVYTPSTRIGSAGYQPTVHSNMQIQDHLPGTKGPLSSRDLMGNPRASTQLITNRYGGPSVRELGKQAAERASREQKALEIRDWEEREILRAKLEEREADPVVESILRNRESASDKVREESRRTAEVQAIVASHAPPPPPLSPPETVSYLKKKEMQKMIKRDLVDDYTRKPTAKNEDDQPSSGTLQRRKAPDVVTTTADDVPTRSYRKPSISDIPTSSYDSRGEHKSGFTGLRNIGNTCFMAATLQMLVNTYELKTYFLNGHHLQDVNRNNVLGFGGRLANAFADLMRQMWDCRNAAIEPRSVKDIVSERASQFSNYAQHDAHEFLSFLLDGLHEDLNRVKSKTPTDSVTADGRPDEQVAAEAWHNHLRRNDSIFVDLFHGQLKSRLQCPLCDRISITFDPFVYLPVPFPKKRSVVKVIYWPVDPTSRPYKVSVSFNPEGTVADMMDALGVIVNEEGRYMRLCEVVSHRFHKIFEAHELTNLISPADNLQVFQLQKPGADKEEIVELFVLQRQLFAHTLSYQCRSCGESNERLKACEACYNAWYCNTECQLADWNTGGHREECGRRPVVDTVGLPLVISIPKNSLTHSNLSKILETKTRHSVEVIVPAQKTSSFTSTEETESHGASRSASNDSNHILPNGDTHMNSLTPSSSAASELARKSNGPEQKKRPTTLFILKRLRSQMSNVGDTIKDAKEELLQLPNKTYLSLNWQNLKHGKAFVRAEDRSSLDLDLEKSAQFCGASSSSRGSDGQPTLEDMISMFSETERLKPEESWYCSGCKEHVEATKKLELYKLPPIIIFQLKRFVYTASLYSSASHRRSKDDRRVEYPLEMLDLKPFLSQTSPQDQDTVYDLCGVVCHSGSSFFGHYVSMGRLTDWDAKETLIGWRSFDDSHVTTVGPSRVQHDDAYLLFYKQRGTTTKELFKEKYGLTEPVKTNGVHFEDEN